MATVPDDIKRGRLSRAEEAAIVDLAARNFSPGRIAQKLNRHPATINYAMHRLHLRAVARRDFAYFRGGVPVKSFSPTEDAYLTALRVQGLSHTQIAILLTHRFGHPRSSHTIGVRLALLANAEAA
jgi:hypothetical protein